MPNVLRYYQLCGYKKVSVLLAKKPIGIKSSERRERAGTCDVVRAIKRVFSLCQRLLDTLLQTRKEKQTNYYSSSVYYKLQVLDQLKTEELLLSDYLTYTTFPAHRPFVSTWVLPRLLDKTLVWLC